MCRHITGNVCEFVSILLEGAIHMGELGGDLGQLIIKMALIEVAIELLLNFVFLWHHKNYITYLC